MSGTEVHAIGLLTTARIRNTFNSSATTPRKSIRNHSEYFCGRVQVSRRIDIDTCITNPKEQFEYATLMNGANGRSHAVFASILG
ncbi:hypothetical protein SERLADRAFT_400526 [Serpula lacrymans var. lacrymans S7.9]|uniref:Uncharacterized protein n=1 Tax=Serpula lacrymans var. lacrymans (strain S7.9) TaxID=578457 RepID=F8P9H7_SERL9|nr:uncharacterized protein SERLADRAFT_400526 [Serpula lacrymans var. lacrymans S7.9]EGO20306.1 hypothetical protein SERLADRAFT_400526 [Serpula lacrymans var. lacrymans S7.9]